MDVHRLRAHTPAALAGVHLNNASAGLAPLPVVQRMRRYLDEELEHGPHAAAERNHEALEHARRATAALMGATAGVEFFDTVARTFALLLAAVPWQRGDRLLLARYEWGAIESLARDLASTAGVGVERIPCREDGTPDCAALAQLLDGRVRAVCLPLLPAVGGRPLLDARLDRPDGCLVLGDAAQALGQVRVDMARTGHDVLVGTARKWLRGPRGIAFAGFSERGRALIERCPWLGGAPDAAAVTSDYTRLLRLGLGAAVDYATALGIDAIRERVLALSARARVGLARIPGLRILAPDPPGSALVTFTCGGGDPALVQALAAHGIRVALLGARYHPAWFSERGIASAVRISPHVYNTEDEVDRCVERVAATLRAQSAP